MAGRRSQEMPRRTVGYVRVSTQDQALNGLSLEAQQARVTAYAVATNRELSEIIVDDGRSAKTLDRPGVQRILAGIRSGEIGAVIIIKLDRLTRSVRDLGDLVELFQQKEADLISVSESLDTGSAGGRMVMNMMATVAQWEREVIGERTASVLAHMRDSGRVYGRTPMGFKRDGDSLVEDPQEMMTLRQMQHMANRGDAYCAIARWLNRTGVQPRQGGKSWSSASVIRVLSSKMSQNVKVS